MRETMDAFLQAKEVSELSLLSYRRDLERLFVHFDNEPERAESAELKRYFSALGETHSSSSLARHASVIRSFYAFLAERGIRKDDPMEQIRAGDFASQTAEVLNREEFRRLISCPIPGFRGMRDRVMLMLLAATGMRVTELVELDGDAMKEGVLVCGTGRRKRELPLTAELRDALCRYRAVAELYARPENGRLPLFVTSRGNRLTRQGFWKNLKDRAVYSGIDKIISPHTLRRSLALHLMEDGKARDEISELLGNADPASLRAYQSGRKR